MLLLLSQPDHLAKSQAVGVIVAISAAAAAPLAAAAAPVSGISVAERAAEEPVAVHEAADV